MEFLDLVFRLGVVLAIFGFIWGIIRLGLTIARGGNPLSYPASLAFKLVEYALVVDLIVLFVSEKTAASISTGLLAGFILLIYFIGKVQRMNNRFLMIQIQMMQSKEEVTPPNMALEFGVVSIAMALFGFLLFYPVYAYNPISEWFYASIIDIEGTFFFGFIFKVIGFFFTVNILFRMFQSFTMILSGQALSSTKSNDKDDDKFDDFEEVN